MNDQEYELFRDAVLDYAATCPMKKCPRCNGSGRRMINTVSYVRCMFCDGKRRVTEEEYEQHQNQAIFP